MYQCTSARTAVVATGLLARERTVTPAAAGGVFARESRERTKLGVCDQRSVVSILFLTSHVSRLISHFSHLISHFSRPFCTGVPACFSQGGRSGFGCVSPAFRPRFACEWNAELTISKRVIGIFRPRFACLQNRIFLLLALQITRMAQIRLFIAVAFRQRFAGPLLNLGLLAQKTRRLG